MFEDQKIVFSVLPNLPKDAQKAAEPYDPNREPDAAKKRVFVKKEWISSVRGPARGPGHAALLIPAEATSPGVVEARLGERPHGVRPGRRRFIGRRRPSSFRGTPCALGSAASPGTVGGRAWSRGIPDDSGDATWSGWVVAMRWLRQRPWGVA